MNARILVTGSPVRVFDYDNPLTVAEIGGVS